MDPKMNKMRRQNLNLAERPHAMKAQPPRCKGLLSAQSKVLPSGLADFKA